MMFTTITEARIDAAEFLSQLNFVNETTAFFHADCPANYNAHMTLKTVLTLRHEERIILNEVKQYTFIMFLKWRVDIFFR